MCAVQEVVVHRSRFAAAAELCVGIAIFSAQDAVIKALSGGYPVHEALVLRTVVALPILLVMVRRAGGLRGAIPARVLIGRGAILLVAYTSYYLALPAMPLASATALYFTAPLFLAALAGPITGEPAPRSTWAAVGIGFLGVVVMVRPGGGLFVPAALLPVLAAAAYAASQLLARRLNAAPAATMSFYQNAAYLVGAFLLAAVTRPFAHLAHDDPSVAFLVRGWAVPTPRDLALLALCGPIAAFGSPLLSNAYRRAGGAIAPFEFTALVWSIILGLVVFGDAPGVGELVGAALIVGSAGYAVTRSG